jgi:hypothetical protein
MQDRPKMTETELDRLPFGALRLDTDASHSGRMLVRERREDAAA